MIRKRTFLVEVNTTEATYSFFDVSTLQVALQICPKIHLVDNLACYSCPSQR